MPRMKTHTLRTGNTFGGRMVVSLSRLDCFRGEFFEHGCKLGNFLLPIPDVPLHVARALNQHPGGPKSFPRLPKAHPGGAS